MSADDDARRDENARKLAEMLAWDGEAEVYLQHLDDNVQYTAPYYDGFGVRASKAEVASMVDDQERAGRTTMVVRRGDRYLGVLGVMDTPRNSAAPVLGLIFHCWYPMRPGIPTI